MTADVVLVRHTQVARAWHSRCYGVSDAGLSRQGIAAIAPLAAELAARDPAWVVRSGLTRSTRLARRIAAHARCALVADPGWRERDFGTWEGQSWAAIHRATGNAMDGMIDAPDQFRPGGGETTRALMDRALAAWRGLPDGPGVVVTHGGPIASLIGHRRGLPVREWLDCVPAPGGMIVLARD